MDMEKIIINTDGGARGNPGPAGIGVVLYNPTGHIVETYKAFIGQATNNVAEYKALLLGLSKAKEMGVREILVRMDSELVVRQMLGIYKVKDEGLKPLAEEAKKLLKSFSKFDFTHVRREQNSLADKLVNEAIDEKNSP